MKPIKILVIMSIFSIFSCNKEKKYLEQHRVQVCSTNGDDKMLPEILVQEKKYKISLFEASKIYIDFLYKKGEISELNYEKVVYPSLIIDDNYVYSFYNMKTRQVAVFGVWINCNTGELTFGKDKIWLDEIDVLKATSK
jgi:hypothetical protein